MERLSAHNLSFRYPDSDRPAVSAATLAVAAGEVAALVGPSGSGKSTIGKILKGILTPDEGEVVWERDGARRPAPPSALMASVGWCDAKPEGMIFSAAVDEEIAFGPANQGCKGAELKRRVELAMSMVGLNPSQYGSRSPLLLSSGERRRVALASVLSMQQRFLVLDEPTAGLDRDGRRSFAELLADLRRASTGVLWITHDVALAKRLADVVIALQQGAPVARCPAAQFDWSLAFPELLPDYSG